ncbi:MAG TPA: hypothetical protein VIR60_02290 [Gammaproteobacteria bacterium]
MMKVYDMVTYSLCAPGADAREQPAVDRQPAYAPTGTELGLQLCEITPERRRSEPHPALRHMDVDAFFAALDN